MNLLTNSEKKKEGKKTGFVVGIEPSTIGSMRLLLTTRPLRMITYSQTVLLDVDFPLILKLFVQIAYIFSAKYFSHRNASPKAFFLNSFLTSAATISTGQR